MTLSKKLIVDPSCKVSNGKGFGGTYPLAPPCAQIEMGIPSLQQNYIMSVLSLYQRHIRVFYLSLWLERKGGGERTPCWQLRRWAFEGFFTQS
jgi:hypothetical protein